MVLGMSRARSRPLGRAQLAIRPLRAAPASDHGWVSERGQIRLQTRVGVTGGFPGFIESGVALRDVQLRISDSYLLIDEGNPRGFGLPIQWLDGAATVARPGRESPGLRIFYRDGAAARHFTVRFRRGLRSWGRGGDAERARHLLLDLGLPDRPEDRDPSAPDVRVSWEGARRYEQESVIWRGKATAPTLLGEDTAPADVWLTTRSIIWGASDGEGINRLPLDALSDVVTGQADVRTSPPAVFVAFLDTAIGRVRFDLPFVFDQHSADQNLRDRGAFLVGLRSRGIALGIPAPLIQPWRASVYRVGAVSGWPNPISVSVDSGYLGVIPAITHRCRDLLGELAQQLPPSAPRTQFKRGPSVERADGRPDDSRYDDGVLLETPDDDEDLEVASIPRDQESDVVLAEFSAPAGESRLPALPVASADIALASDWYEPVTVAASAPEVDEAEHVELEPERSEPDISSLGDQPRLDCSRVYEAALLSLLSDALIAIRDRTEGLPGRPLRRVAPTQAMERAAFAELRDYAESGNITDEEADLRRVRLTAISEAARRLRSLVELRDAGHLTDSELAFKRSEISEELSGLILAGSGLADKS